MTPRRAMAALILILPLVSSGAAPAGADAPNGPAGSAPAATISGGKIIAAYTLIAPKKTAKSRLVTRAVLPANTPCPTLKLTRATGKGPKQKSLQMKPRSPGATAAPAFNTVVVCSHAMPTNASKATVQGLKVPSSLPRTATEIALFADTGCRIEGNWVQDCKSATAWPLAAIARQIAQRRPDVILNPGDYFYRESPCPAWAAAKCGGSPAPVPGMPFKDSSEGWLSDAIYPMRPVFSVAPLAMLRGNHEACDRGGNGFMLFFDPRKKTASLCAPTNAGGQLVAPTGPPAMTNTWAFDLNVAAGRTLRVAMVDSAYGEDSYVQSSTVGAQKQRYQKAQSLTKQAKGRESWMMTHRPIFGQVGDNGTHGPLWSPWVSVEQTAASKGLLGNYQLLISSHIHLAQAIQVPGQPGSLVVGNGGTELESQSNYALPPYGPLAKGNGTPLVPGYTPYPPATMSWTRVQFGFAIATPGKSKGAWWISQRSDTGAKIGDCRLQARKLSC